MSEKLVIIKTLPELRKLKAYIEAQDGLIAYDTESTGVEINSQVIGFSVCADENLGYYVITHAWNKEQQRLDELETTKETKDVIQALVGKQLVMQNSPHDCRITKSNYGIELMPYVVHDTLIGGHLLNENRPNGLKERGVELFGEDAREEQRLMKESVIANGGQLTKKCYELYKADADLIAKYGAKDAILTLKVALHDIPKLFEEGLDKFFYDDESMPLLRGPTYEMNTQGLRVDPVKIQDLRGSLEAEIEETKAFILSEIAAHVKDKYPGGTVAKTFNIGATKQLAWLLFEKLGNEFNLLTDSGKEVCKFLDLRLPYSAVDKREFIRSCRENYGRVYKKAGSFNQKTKKVYKTDQKIKEPWHYMAAGKATFAKLAPRYKWVQKLIEYNKSKKLLTTYVLPIQAKSRDNYNIIRPSFLQHGTTSGRYSSRGPNFQNLPRDDKRVKACIISRPGKVFVGADYSQLEPRVFASQSGDERLMGCFAKKEDFYSVVGVPVFGKYDADLKKKLPDGSENPNFFRLKYEKEGQQSKIVSLSATYGKTKHSLAPMLGVSSDEAQEIIDAYFTEFPKVKKLQLSAHEEAKKNGVVYNLFGRPRRMPEAMRIPKVYGAKTRHEDLPYEARNLLNLAINHKIQSSGASIMNRAAIAFWFRCKELAQENPLWNEVKILMQVHDELIAESPEELGQLVVKEMKYAMEKTVTLPGVELVAEPKIAYNLADLK